MNKFIGIGRLTRDPDIRYANTQSGQTCVARYTLAIDRRGGDDAGADFISCVAFGKSGEFAEKYLSKGMKIAVFGRIQTGSYTKDGQKFYTTDVVVSEHYFCESKNAAAAAPAPAPADQDGFMSIPDGVEDEGLPFN